MQSVGNTAGGATLSMRPTSGNPPGARRGGIVLPAVRSATLADAEALATLAGESGRPTTAATVVERLQRLIVVPNVAVLVAADAGGSVVGWLHVAGQHTVDFPPRAEVLGLGVDAAARGRQVGTALLGVAEQWARRHGYLDLVVRTDLALPRVLGFYERRGYTKWKEQQLLRKPLV